MTLDQMKSVFPSSGYLRQAQLIPEIIPFSSATLWRKVKAGHFPKPVKLSTRITVWRVEEIRAWMENKWDPQAEVGKAGDPTPPTFEATDIAIWRLGATRYEALRLLNARQFGQLCANNISGLNFDWLVDRLIESSSFDDFVLKLRLDAESAAMHHTRSAPY